MSRHEPISRVPMPPKPDSFVKDDEVAFEGPRIGKRFSLIVDEALLARLGKEAIEVAVVTLGKDIVYRHQHEIENAVHSYIMDREWAEPIIREAIRETVARVVTDMFTDHGEEP